MTESAATRLVLDQGVPRDVARRLRELGYECTHVGEIGMSRATDQQILAWAVEQHATFHAILAVSGATAPSVIRMRMQGLDTAAVAEIVRKILAAFPADLTHGALVTVKARKTTCHKLPIGAVIS